MFLFIFESIGTSELILVGIVALIFLGPRKLPQMARKMGKMMAEFRGTANEFKETWAREVNFEEEAKLLSIDELTADTVARSESVQADDTARPAAPAIRDADASALEELKRRAEGNDQAAVLVADTNDKKNWV